MVDEARRLAFRPSVVWNGLINERLTTIRINVARRNLHARSAAHGFEIGRGDRIVEIGVVTSDLFAAS
jgi:hypothetical protein